MSYTIITDSCADLNQNMVDELNIDVIPMSFELNVIQYKDYPDQHEMNIKDFYKIRPFFTVISCFETGKRLFISKKVTFISAIKLFFIIVPNFLMHNTKVHLNFAIKFLC